MGPVEMSKPELKELMKEAMISVLTERRDLLEDVVSEAILDMKLGSAIEEGDIGEFVPESEILKRLAAKGYDYGLKKVSKRIKEKLLETIEEMPENKLGEVLDFIEFLVEKERKKEKRVDIEPGNDPILEYIGGVAHGTLAENTISINKQWRVCFEWRDGNAYDVEITDYH